jgi:hypothetical protein
LRLMLPFMRKSIRRQAEADLRKLRDLVEGAVRSGASTSGDQTNQ